MKTPRRVLVALFLAAVALAHPTQSAMADDKSVYNGLVLPEAGLAPKQSGFLTLDLFRNGHFSGKIFVGSRNGPFHGTFDSAGTATVRVKVSTGHVVYDFWSNSYAAEKKVAWILYLQLADDGAQITGQVSEHRDNGWISNLSADVAGYSSTNPAPQAGNYTFVIPGQVPGVPGSGCASLTVDSLGKVSLTGRLADGSAFSRTAVLNQDGAFPLYSAEYGGIGMISGWLVFTNLPETDLTGQLTWVKPARPGADFNPEGFTNDVLVVGSRYTPPVGASDPVLDLTNGILAFQDGDLSLPFSNSVTLDAENKISNNSSNRLTLKIKLRSGQFDGKAQDPATGKSFPFRGVVMQKQNNGPGYFRGKDQLGSVLLEPAP